MRALLVYLLALVAVAAAVALAFPEWWRTDEAAAAADKAPPAAPPVVIATVDRTPFADTIEALGTVLANESVEIRPARSERVAAIHFVDGQEVEAGDLLVELQAAEDRALLAEARAVFAERQASYDRELELLDREITAQSEVDRVRALKLAAEARVENFEAVVRDLEIRAPFAGTLGLRRISLGAFVDPNTVVTTLDDLKVVKADFTIPETWLAEVRVGMDLRARSDAYRDEVFPGTVAAIDTRLDPTTRAARIRAELPNPERLLRPGMLLKIQVERGEEDVMQLPESAIVPRGQQAFVWRIDDASIAHEVEVGLGRRRVGTVEIVSGLEVGDRVVTRGILRVRDGAAVEVVDATVSGS